MSSRHALFLALLTGFCVFLMPSFAFAHIGLGDAVGFGHGLMHPLSGLDHLLAMTLVGLFAWQIGGRAMWLVPVSFVVVMVLGGVVGMAGVALPFVELGIAVSVTALGALVATGWRASVPVAMSVVGLFALFHGHAHGVEMPEDASGLAFGAGFVLSAAGLHAAGVGLGVLTHRLPKGIAVPLVRSAGLGAALAGVLLLVTVS